MQKTIESSIWTKLFIEGDLETWANILEIVGFTLSVIAFIISLIIRSDIKKLKTDLLFEKRVKKHLANLLNSSSKLNNYLNDYNRNKIEIKTELSICIAELQDLIKKIGFWESLKSRKLICFLKSRRNKKLVDKKDISSGKHYLTKHFVRIYETNYEDIWEIYDSLNEVIRQIENIKENKHKAR